MEKDLESLSCTEALEYLDDIAHGRKMSYDPHELKLVVEKGLNNSILIISIYDSFCYSECKFIEKGKVYDLTTSIRFCEDVGILTIPNYDTKQLSVKERRRLYKTRKILKENYDLVIFSENGSVSVLRKEDL